MDSKAKYQFEYYCFDPILKQDNLNFLIEMNETEKKEWMGGRERLLILWILKYLHIAKDITIVS